MKHKHIVLWSLVGLIMVFSQSCGSKDKPEQTEERQEAVLDRDKISRAMSFFEAMVNMEEADIEDPEAGSEAVLDELAVEHGLTGFSEFEQITMSSNGAFSLMHSFVKIQELEEGSEAYKFTFNIIESFIQQAKLSYQDIRFVFNEWDHVKAYVKQLEAHKNSQ